MALRNALETFSEEGQLAQLHELTSDECDALFELLMLGVLVDGELSHEEAEILIDEFQHLPFFSIARTADLKGERGFVLRGKLLERVAAGETRAMLEGIAGRLPTREHRLAALRALALAVEPDGVADDELSFALEAASVFGVSDVETLDLIKKAWEFNHRPFGE